MSKRLFKAFKYLIIANTFIFLLVSCYGNHKIKIDPLTEACLLPFKNHKFKLCDELIVKTDENIQVIPKGFTTDLASIPWPMWWLFSPNDAQTIWPSILHDWHYCCDADISRLDADNIYYYALLENDTPRFKAFLYWWSVRSFGWLSFRKGQGLHEHVAELTPYEKKNWALSRN